MPGWKDSRKSPLLLVFFFFFFFRFYSWGASRLRGDCIRCWLVPVSVIGQFTVHPEHAGLYESPSAHLTANLLEQWPQSTALPENIQCPLKHAASIFLDTADSCAWGYQGLSLWLVDSH